jgi:hypothetical protein
LASAWIIMAPITMPLATDDALGHAAAYCRLEQEVPQPLSRKRPWRFLEKMG